MQSNDARKGIVLEHFVKLLGLITLSGQALEPVLNLAVMSRKWRICEQRTAAYLIYVRSAAQQIRYLRPSQVEI
jgi:hypothetical protein